MCRASYTEKVEELRTATERPPPHALDGSCTWEMKASEDGEVW